MPVSIGISGCVASPYAVERPRTVTAMVTMKARTAYVYKGKQSKWKYILWDLDLGFGYRTGLRCRTLL